MKESREVPTTVREENFSADWLNRFSIAHKRRKPIRDMVINLMSDKKHSRKIPIPLHFFLSYLPYSFVHFKHTLSIKIQKDCPRLWE